MQVVFCIKQQMHVVKIYNILTEISTLQLINYKIICFHLPNTTQTLLTRRHHSIIFLLSEQGVDTFPLSVNKVQHFPFFSPIFIQFALA